ncbi:MAG: PhoX family protein [Planctomycetota bacterium]|jgi:secreted PhoX family phosphatase
MNFQQILELRLSRRSALGAAAALPSLLGARSSTTGPSSLSFAEAPATLDATDHVAPGHTSQVVIAWGDPVLPEAPTFDPSRPDAAAQALQFGHGNDYVAFTPLPYGSSNSTRGLLTVNHEHCYSPLMWPSDTLGDAARRVPAEQAAVGMTVVEVRRLRGRWEVVDDSPYARRIATDTPLTISGPAAGAERMRTSDDPTGRTVLGTLGNCSGGTTPWGTVLSGEENVQDFFGGKLADESERRNHSRMGVPTGAFRWWTVDARFDVAREPREANRFGWVVEVDPYDPHAPAIKRTALGRFTHEAATTTLTPEGRVVVYLGDDRRNEFLYRYVSDGRYNPDDRSANASLLDEGVLSVARFEADGRLVWLPLVHGEGPLTSENGFDSQADVLIETRTAASLLGATPMDRPEDVEASPTTGRVYVALTNNTDRGKDGKPQVDAANSRAVNRHGHILELTPPGTSLARQHDADEFTWEALLLAGNPEEPEHGADYHSEVSEQGWLSCPDNLMFDSRGRLWIATDGMDKSGVSDGLYACDTDGPGRALTRRFYGGPRGCEICGPCFTPDERTLFLAVQHPGLERGSSFDSPSTRWPDAEGSLPPRPAVIAIEREDGGQIG